MVAGELGGQEWPHWGWILGCPHDPQTPGTTSVSSVPGLSALAATCSSTGAFTLERSPCSEFVERCGGVMGHLCGS